MPFSQFKFPDVIAQLGLSHRQVPDLFPNVKPVPPGPGLAASQKANYALGSMAHTEASRSTWLVGPVLADLWARYAGQLSLIAGVEFAADPAADLTGYVDFIVSRSPQTHLVTPPVLVVFEAKRDSIPDGLGQGIAGVVGARRFNDRHGQKVDPVYGCVTTGSLWRFLRLCGDRLETDLSEYAHTEVDKLLGILAHIAGPPPG